tara:strand:- start:4851 stop:5144 length:294 start_codon:yes stop_codon:yes gene_type:complete
MSDIEVEVNDQADAQDIVRAMMDKMASGDTTGAADDFNVAMGQRVGNVLADRKAEIANGVFNNSEMQKMGLEAEPEVEVEEPAEESEVENGETDEDV